MPGISIYTNAISLIPLIGAIFVCALGFLAFLKNRKFALNRIFFLYSVSIGIWLFGTYKMFFACHDAAKALFWDQFVYLGVVFIPAISYHFSVIFLNSKRQKKFVFLGYLFSFLFLSLVKSSLFIYGLFTYKWGCHTIAQPLHNAFLLFFFISIAAAFVNIYLKIQRTTEISEKIQARYVFVALLVLSFGSIAFLPAYKIAVFPFAYLSGLICAIILAYAVFKHHLMNIRVISTELFAGLITVVFLFNVLLSKSLHQFLVSAPLLVLVTVFGIFLVRGTLREIKVLEDLTTKLKEANETLKKLDQAKSEFISIASHQLRTPISIIKGFSSMLQEGNYGALPEKAKEVVGKIGTSTERLNRLINDLLDLSRMEGGKMQFNWESISLTDLVASGAEELKPVADQNQLELRWRPPQDKLYVRADQEKLRQVILNLIDNAIKYTLKGYVEIELEKTKAGSARLSVKDTGIGMDKEEMALIFGKFVRGKKVPRLWTEGVGLGLYIAKKIIEEHKGKIWAESQGEGKGSAFFVEIPMY